MDSIFSIFPKPIRGYPWECEIKNPTRGYPWIGLRENRSLEKRQRFRFVCKPIRGYPWECENKKCLPAAIRG